MKIKNRLKITALKTLIYLESKLNNYREWKEKRRMRKQNNSVVVVAQLQQVLNHLSSEHSAIMQNDSKLMIELKSMHEEIKKIHSILDTTQENQKGDK